MKSFSAHQLFVDNIKARLIKDNLTPGELAKGVGCTQAAIHKILINKGSPSLKTVSKIADHFGVEPFELFKPVKAGQLKGAFPIRPMIAAQTKRTNGRKNRRK